MGRTLAVIAVFAALGSIPAEARSIRTADDERLLEDSRRLAERIDDPEMQDRIADGMAGLTEALLTLPVGPFARAMDDVAPGSVDPDIRDGDTVADITGRDGRAMADDVRDDARRTGREMARSARAMASAMPALVEALGSLRGAIADIDDDLDAPYQDGRYDD